PRVSVVRGILRERIDGDHTSIIGGNMARDDRMKEDHAGIGPEPGSTDRLHRLSESQHYRIAGGEPDIRGWEVRTLTGSHLGEVEDLLIDPHRGEVVMLDVDLNDS